jgi:NNP family nitrate/nitrite transporter-like MFS transporter
MKDVLPLDPRTLPRKVLALNTSSFALAFAAWVVLGPSSRLIASELHLSAANATLLKAAPILVGSLCRIPVGLLTDRFGARVVFPLLLGTGAVAAAWLGQAHDFGVMLAAALLLGCVGTTFVVGVQAVSSFTGPARQGTALGIFGAGNVGTALTTAFFPMASAAWGWRGALHVYAAVLALGALGYAASAPRPLGGQRGASLRERLAPLSSGRAFCFSFYYTATFGAFVAATLMMSDLYMDAYHVLPRSAGLLATTFTLTAGITRIFGGNLSDRWGADKTLRWSLLGIALSLAPLAFAPPLVATLMLAFVSAIAMGCGMAAVFRYIPDHFPKAVGTVGGVVGALGGLGGFFLPFLGQWLSVWSGVPHLAILPLPLLASAAYYLQANARGSRAAEPARPSHLSLRPSH